MPKGGKGDKTSSEIKLPPEITALANRNLTAAEQAGKIGFVPYQGPTVAALNPMQINSMQQNANAMQAFGMGGANVANSIPQAKTYAGGIQGYDPMALYLEALKKIDPNQMRQIQSPTFRTPASAVNKDGTVKRANSPAASGGRSQSQPQYGYAGTYRYNGNGNWSDN